MTSPPPREPSGEALAFSEFRAPEMAHAAAEHEGALRRDALQQAVDRLAENDSQANSDAVLAAAAAIPDGVTELPVQATEALFAEQSRHGLVAHLGIAGDTLPHQFDHSVNPILRARVTSIMRWVGQITGPDHNRNPIRVVQASGRYRSGYSTDGTLQLACNETPTWIAHECGHHLEESPAVRAAAQAFYRHRFGNERAIDLSHHFAGADPGEMARRDHMAELFHGEMLDAYYIGKEYPNGQTELVSSGVMLLHRNPSAFAATDPEYFNWIIGVLRGAHS